MTNTPQDDSAFAVSTRQPLTPPRTPERANVSPSQTRRWDAAAAKVSSLSTPDTLSRYCPDPANPSAYNQFLVSPVSVSSLKLRQCSSGEVDSPSRSFLRMDDVLRPRELTGMWEPEIDSKGKPAAYGSGGFSTVYKAAFKPQESGAAQLVAVKVPQDRDTAAAIEREAKILTFLQPSFDADARSHHPFLVDFVGWDVPNSSIVLEALPWNLYDFSQNARQTRKAGEPAVGTKLWLHFALRLVSGLKFLADVGVIHGDVKPANVLLRPAPAGSEMPYDPVFCDFTSATLDEYKTGLEAPTTTGGTTEFSSPELITRLRSQYDSLPTTDDDIFALAVTLLTPALGDNIYSAAPNRFLRLEWVKQGQPLRYIASVWKLPKGNVVERCLAGAVAPEKERWSLEQWVKIIEEQWTALY